MPFAFESSEYSEDAVEKLTRRGLLHSVGAAAGAAAAELPLGSGEGGRVVILGAGLSGLAAAWEMSKAGWQCVLLEASGRAGGRSLTARGGDVLVEEGGRQEVRFDREDYLYANLGPARIPYHHSTVLGYCKAFGIDLEVFTNDNRTALLHDGARFAGRSPPGEC